MVVAGIPSTAPTSKLISLRKNLIDYQRGRASAMNEFRPSRTSKLSRYIDSVTYSQLHDPEVKNYLDQLLAGELPESESGDLGTLAGRLALITRGRGY